MAFLPYALLGQHPDEEDGPSQYVTTTAPGVILTSPVRTMPASARRGLTEQVVELEALASMVSPAVLMDRARALYMHLRMSREWSGGFSDPNESWEDRGELLRRVEAKPLT